jgi:hypothetical protein
VGVDLYFLRNRNLVGLKVIRKAFEIYWYCGKVFRQGSA